MSVLANFVHSGRACWARCAMAVSLALGTTLAGAQLRVSVPSLEGQGVAPVMQPSYWFEAVHRVATPAMEGPGAASSAAGTQAHAASSNLVHAKRPAVVLLHGCGGPYAAGAAARERRELSPRLLAYAEHLRGLGLHVLVTDSLSSRGEKELCTQKIGQRRVTQRERRRDALGAVAWLAEHPRVDRQRIALLGWSHGGSAVLAATDLEQAEVRAQAVQPALAIAFYPGCSPWQRRYEPSAPLLVMIGEDDDWTPAEPCVSLGARLATVSGTQPKVQVVTYPGAVHAFDSFAAVRVREDVPQGVRPGQGVKVGGHEPSRVASQAMMDQFFRDHRFVLP